MLQGNNISDYSPLKHLKNLKQLNLKFNPIENAVKIYSLEIIDISYTKIPSLTVFEDMKSLKELYAEGLKIEQEIEKISAQNTSLRIYTMPNRELGGCNPKPSPSPNPTPTPNPILKERQEDRLVYNDKGFNQSGLHKNASPFDDQGYDKDGFNKIGFNREGLQRDGSKYDAKGFDIFGFDKNGFNKDKIHKNGTSFDDSGYDIDGYNLRGFNSTGRHRNGTFFGDDSFDQYGFNVSGFNASGLHRNRTGYDDAGYNQAGYDARGFNRNRQHENGTSYDTHGYDKDGYNRDGFNSSGMHRNGTSYDSSGLNAFGFDANGVDIRGLTGEAANRYREEKAAAFLQELEGIRSPLFDTILYSEIGNFAELKDAFNSLVGHDIVAVPTDQVIYNDLKKTRDNLLRWSSRHYQLDNIASLKHNPTKLTKAAKYIDFEKVWSDLNVDDSFYERIFRALDQRRFYQNTDFPDPTDAGLNGDIGKKKDYLIIFLASLKNNSNQRNNHQLTNAISANLTTHVPFPTWGNAPMWFAEMRYKLYKISEKIPAMDDNDKKTLLSHFLHAGKHCSDAKKDQINTALALFNPEANTALELMQRDLASSLEERMEYTASREKAKILQGRVDAAYEKAINGNVSVIYNSRDHDPRYILLESFTFKAATWDFYADRLGLKKNGTTYSGMRLLITDNELFGPGAYTPRHLYNSVRTENGDEILDAYVGSMRHVMQFHDKIYAAVLIEKGFLIP